jgi:hypothetical protein
MQLDMKNAIVFMTCLLIYWDGVKEGEDVGWVERGLRLNSWASGRYQLQTSVSTTKKRLLSTFNSYSSTSLLAY